MVAGISENPKYAGISLCRRILKKSILEAMLGVAWNSNAPRMTYPMDADEIRSVQNVPDTHGSQEIGKSKIRPHTLMRAYFGKTVLGGD